MELTSFAEVLVSHEVSIGTGYYGVGLFVEALTLVRADGSREDVSLAPGQGRQRRGTIFSAFRWADMDKTGTLPGFAVGANGPGRLVVDINLPLDVALYRDADAAVVARGTGFEHAAALRRHSTQPHSDSR